MRAGELRHRIVIQLNTPTRNTFNEEVASWSTFATLWAKVETVGGAETIDQKAAAALRSHVFTVRCYPGLLPEMRVSWDSRYFDISAVLDDNLKRETKLQCSEVV